MLKGLHWHTLLLYPDDIVVVAKNFNKHISISISAAQKGGVETQTIQVWSAEGTIKIFGSYSQSALEWPQILRNWQLWKSGNPRGT